MCSETFGPPDDYVYDDIVLPSEQNAKDAGERRIVFDAAVGNHWPGDDIGMIQRFETGDRHCYAVWRYPRGVA